MIQRSVTSRCGHCCTALLLFTAFIISWPACSAEFVVSKILEFQPPRGASKATCWLNNERIVVFGDSNYRPGYVVVQEKDRRVDVVPSGGDWIAIQCPSAQGVDMHAISPTGVLRSADGVSWETVFRPDQGKITAAAFLGDTIFLTTNKRQLLIREAGHWSSLPLNIEDKPYQLYFSSRRKGVLWVETPNGASKGYWTADGAKTWSPATLSALEEKVASHFGSTSTGFFDEDRGVAIGYYLIGKDVMHALIVTADGGKTWRPLPGGINPLYMQINRLISLDKGRLLVASNLALYLMKAGSDMLSKLTVRNAKFEGVPLKERFEGYSASVQGADVLVLADEPVQYVLFGRVVETEGSQ